MHVEIQTEPMSGKNDKIREERGSDGK